MGGRHVKADLKVKALEPTPTESSKHSGKANQGGPCVASPREEVKPASCRQGGRSEDPSPGLRRRWLSWARPNSAVGALGPEWKFQDSQWGPRLAAESQSSEGEGRVTWA